MSSSSESESSPGSSQSSTTISLEAFGVIDDQVTEEAMWLAILSSVFSVQFEINEIVANCESAAREFRRIVTTLTTQAKTFRKLKTFLVVLANCPKRGHAVLPILSQINRSLSGLRSLKKQMREIRRKVTLVVAPAGKIRQHLVSIVVAPRESISLKSLAAKTEEIRRYEMTSLMSHTEDIKLQLSSAIVQAEETYGTFLLDQIENLISQYTAETGVVTECNRVIALPE